MAKFLSLKTSRLTIGFLGDEKPADRAEDADEGEDRHRDDKCRAKPVVIFAAIHHHLETAEAERDEAEADEVDPARFPLLLLLFPRRILDQDQVEEHCDSPDRNVDEEDPSPRRLIGDVAAQRRAENRRDDGGDCCQTESRAPLGRLERVEDDRLLVRLQTTAEKALHQSEDH